MELRQDLDEKIRYYLTVTPEVREYPAYHPTGLGNIKAITYEGALQDGKKTKVFAYLGYPVGAKPGDRLPAVVLVHGGAGHAFSGWVKTWNDHGYVAIAMDNVVDAAKNASTTISDGDNDHDGLARTLAFLFCIR